MQKEPEQQINAESLEPANGNTDAEMRARFFTTLDEREDQDLVVVSERLLQWAGDNATAVSWGEHRGVPNFTPLFGPAGAPQTFISVSAMGRVDVPFGELSKREQFGTSEKRLELVRIFNEIPGVAMPDFVIDKRATFSLSALIKDEAFTHFLTAVDWFHREAGI